MALKANLTGTSTAYINAITVVRGAYGQVIYLQALDNTATAINLTGNTSLTFQVRSLGSSTNIVSSTSVTVDTATNGTCHYTTVAADFATEGIYYGELLVAYASQTLKATDLVIAVIDEAKPTVAMYANQAEVNNYLKPGFEFSDTSTPTISEVNAYVMRATKHIDLASGHDWLTHTVTGELYDAKSGQRIGLIELANKPVTAVTNVYYWTTSWLNTFQGQANDPLNTAPYPNYFVYLPQGTIKFPSLGVIGMQKFKVDYTYGYSTVPLDVNDLCIRMAALDTILAMSSGEISQFSVATLRLVYAEGYEFGVQAKLLYESINRDLGNLRRFLTAAG